MKVLVISVWNLGNCPPTISLVKNLLSNGHRVCLVCPDRENIHESFEGDFIYYGFYNDPQNVNVVKRVHSNAVSSGRAVEYVKKVQGDYDIIWTATDSTVVKFGHVIDSSRHVMQLLELSEYTPRFGQSRWFKFDIQKYARQAYRVVVPEANRGYILRTWWKLDRTPAVLPNKPYSDSNSTMTPPQELESVIAQMQSETRRIVLYQGVFYRDRNLDLIAEAIDKLSDRYCLYIMGKETDYSRELCKAHPDIRRVPFVSPPNHLFITKNAHIGLMPYIPVQAFHYSCLNALYCAPNKIFEYSKFGLPMLGSDVPGIAIPFERFRMGCIYENNVDSIAKGLETIDGNYEQMSKNAIDYFNSIDLDKIVAEIIGA